MNKQLLIMIISILVIIKCHADTHYVSLSGTNNSPYTNWADASTDVTWAVTAAGANDTVLVTNGVYYPTQRCYTASIITLRSVNGRDVTIINGANNTNICAELGSSSVFDGFTVTNCYNTKFYGLLSITTVRNCLFVNNTTKGGTVSGCSSVTNCIFKNNSASTLSGAIYAAGGAAGITIAGCYFEGNYANAYGGACDIRSQNNTVSNCVFINNRARVYGGALFLSSTVNNFILNCTFTENVVAGDPTEAFGGGIYCDTGPTTIKDCSIIGNIASNVGGGICVRWQANATIQNCLIARNQSTTNTGGGIWMTNGNVESCTIVSNYAKVSGGGLYFAGSGNTGTNNIIYFNTAGVSANNFTNSAGNTGLNYSCVIPVVDGIRNITNNPVLKNLAGGDYHLRVTSPCVNAGTNQNWMNNAADRDGALRIRYGIVDMGAYETIIRQGNVYRTY